ncbi:LOW QUALITY PROTEIN: polyunsaturated fatty acid lipoxygenase ALOX12-like [Dugong dugon]
MGRVTGSGLSRLGAEECPGYSEPRFIKPGTGLAGNVTIAGPSAFSGIISNLPQPRRADQPSWAATASTWPRGRDLRVAQPCAAVAGRGARGEVSGEAGMARLGSSGRAEDKTRRQEEFEQDVPNDLGPLQFVKLRKHHSLVDDAWFCDHITVRGPGACAEAAFPCYRWVRGQGILSLPEGTAGPPGRITLTIAAGCRDDLPPNMRFHEDKRLDFEALEIALKRVYTLLSSWDQLEDFDQIFWVQKNVLAEKVHQCWQDNELFGYQSTNHMLLRCSTSLPSGLALPSGTEELQSQEKELQNSSLFKADFILLDGILTSMIRGEKQYLAAPLVMLKMEPNGKLLPMVIQFDWYSWVPNAPCSMQMAPPTTKEEVTMATVIGSLPDVHQSCLQMLLVWQLSWWQPDMVPLGCHIEEYFTGSEPKSALRQFQTDLDNLEREIMAWNKYLDLPYEHLKPSHIENSVTI